MPRTRNFDYDGDLEIFPEGYSPDKHKVGFSINYDFTPGYPGCMYQRNGDPGDPPEPADVCVNSVKLFVNGEKTECPQWLESLILDAIDEETLAEQATEDAL